MKQCNNETIKEKGFTLAEILVAVAIFSLVVGIASGLFVSAIRAQRKTLATQELLDQTSYTMEYMSRAIRMAKKELYEFDPHCLTDYGCNYEKTYEGNGLKFINSRGTCQEFFLENEQLKEWKEGYTAPLALTSDDLQIIDLKFKLRGECQEDPPTQPDYNQPRVTFFLNIKGKGEKPEAQPEIKIQTTISQRNLDVIY